MASNVEILAEAFAHDEMFSWIFCDPATRPAHLRWLMGRLVRCAELAGRVSTVDGAGVALWLAPGQDVTPSLIVRSGLWQFPFRTSWPALARYRRTLVLEHGAPPAAHDPGDWYLLCLAVAPGHQGGGVASRLVADVFELADRQGRGVRLETYHRANVALYRHWGFDVVAELANPGVPPVWMMRRPPVRRT